MKISEKKPIRQRGRSNEKKQATMDTIRNAYKNGPAFEVQIIPAKKDLELEKERKKLRVCAYCRVSTDEEAQAGSYELQVQEYTKKIQDNKDWEFVGIFADRGISGTSVRHRSQFLKMIEKCEAGEIDLIITKQISRFARNFKDSMDYIYKLREMSPPVGIFFEAEGLDTLDKRNDMLISILSLVAQAEAEQKSDSVKWAFKRRRARGLGIYPNWALLGYDLDEDKNWVIVQEEGELVRAIYDLYLSGYSSCQIADQLTKSGIPTVKGKKTWRPGSVLGILSNEKYCGDALCQKTVTPDYRTHKSVKNINLETKYFIEEHHIPIIEKRDWLLAQQIREERRYIRNRRKRCKPQIVVKGSLAGFLLADPDWSNEDVDAILEKYSGNTNHEPPIMQEDDENFMIEKE